MSVKELSVSDNAVQETSSETETEPKTEPKPKTEAPLAEDPHQGSP